MKRKIFYTLLMMASVIYAEGQEAAKTRKKPCGCAFSSLNQSGIVVGEFTEAFQLQTINGMRYRSWFAGLGIGLDDYRYRSVPVFFSLRKELLRKTNTPFLYNDIGVNFPWVTNKQMPSISFGQSSDFRQGFYYEGGVGYKIGVRKYGILLSGGFSLKQLRELRTTNFCDFMRCDGKDGRYKYSLRRASLKMGVQL